MDDPFATIMAQTRAWFDDARAADWLDDTDLARLQTVEQGTPADLFVDRQMRPLVVALFGGTGVGKSSLLNRIAGETIARTGQERPTSREVTVYVHSAVELADLPADLPLDAMQVKRHGSDAWRDVLWIDAPDIDSTEEANRRSALAWLPHVDLVCYVVSPERYRDDVGWRQLRERGQKHGWMFIINRWDEGDLSQAEDFERMLGEAGFEKPLLLRTCCVGDRTLPSPDELARIETTLSELLRAHGVRELDRLGHRARLRALRSALQPAQQRLGDDATWEHVFTAFRAGWQTTQSAMLEGAEWSLRAAAARFAVRSEYWWQQLGRGLLKGDRTQPGTQAADEEPTAQLDDVVGRLWDDWTQTKVGAWLDATEVAIGRRGLAAAPVRGCLDELAQAAGPAIASELADSVRAAFARPGSALARAARRATGFLMAFLPAVAIGVVALATAQGYYRAVRGEHDFLGTPFAVNSVLLVLTAWALPFTIDRLLRPSMEKTALRALRRGFEVGLSGLGGRLEAALREQADRAGELRQQSAALLTRIAGLLVKPIDARTPAVGRLLARSTGAST